MSAELQQFDSEDYYVHLGVAKEATTEEIRRAYTNLALKWHPDKNPESKEQAELIFVKISTSYSVLSDPKRRAVYDQFGKSGLTGMDGDLSAEQAVEVFSQIFDKLFIYGYKPDEVPDEPNSKHGLKQAVKGAIQAPLVGAGTGAVAFAGSLLVGGAHVIGGVGEGVGNFFGGIKEIGKAASGQKVQVQASEESEIVVEPDWKNGLKRATVGLALPPLKGLGKGVQSVAMGAGAAIAMVGSGTYGAYVNVKQGRAEIMAAEQLERDSGIPEKVQRGEALKRKHLLQKLEEQGVLQREAAEDLQYFRCLGKVYNEVKDEEGKVTKELDEVKNCVFLTNSRFVKIENGKATVLVPTSDITDCVLVEKSIGYDRLEISTNDNNNQNQKILVEIPGSRICAFFAWKLQAQRSKVACPPIVTQGREALAPFIVALEGKCDGWAKMEGPTEWDPEPEVPLYHYCNEYSRDLAMDSVSHCVVATSRRIVLVEDMKVKQSVPYTEVTTVRLESKGLLQWDRLIILSANAITWTIPISRNKAAVFFTALVQQLSSEAAAAKSYLSSPPEVEMHYVQEDPAPNQPFNGESNNNNNNGVETSNVVNVSSGSGVLVVEQLVEEGKRVGGAEDELD